MLLEAVAWGLALCSMGLSAFALRVTARAARRSVAPTSDFRPFISVIVPVKGEQQGLAENARAFVRQDYPAFEVMFVVDGTDDPSYPVLAEVAREDPRARVVLADPAAVGSWPSGKMVAQLSGVRAADPQGAFLAFADADARPSPRWLACLVEPLADPAVGVSSGYRWYTARDKPSLWTMLRDAVDHTGLDAMTQAKVRLVWGGSMAVRRAEFERGEVSAAWRKSVADDVGLSRAYNAMGLRKVFAPGAMAASPEDASRTHVQEFLTRQMAILRAAHPAIYTAGVALYAFSAGLTTLGLALVAAWPGPALGWAGVALLSPLVLGIPRAWLRESLVLRAVPALRERPRRERAGQLALSILVPWCMLLLALRVRRVAQVTWRGRTYALEAPQA